MSGMIRTFSRNLPLALGIFILSAGLVTAQSGRRGVKQPPPAVVKPSVSKPAEPSPTTQKAWRVQLLVGIQDPSPFDGNAYYLADTVLAACVGRLNEADGVKASVAARRTTRADAVKAAKAETERYVVWMQVGNDSADANRQVNNTTNEIYLTYMVLEPGSAKVKKSGRVQPGVYKVGNVGVGGPSSRRSPIYSDYAVKQSARQAAEQILSAFGIRADGPGLARVP
ncbi:MAG TPA: hypothetical protein VIF81_07635 [Pyrinomonadaceae bacterium]